MTGARIAAAWRRVPAAVRVPLRLATLLLAVSFVTFVLVAASPIDPVQANAGQAAMLSMSPERQAALAARWGAGTGLLERYGTWLFGALHGDLGESLRYNAPVVQVVAERFVNSAALLALAWALSGAIGLVLGVAAGAQRGSLCDRAVSLYCYVLSATPAFWLAIVALMVFAVGLGWFPVGFSAPIGASGAVPLADRARHIVLPALVLSCTGVANVALHTREKTIEVMGSPYVRFARARGEGELSVVVRHGVRNLVLPAITLAFAQVSEIFGGSVLVEQVFSYPGLGQAAVTAGLGGDAPLLVGIALASALIVFAGNLVANALYGVVDPRLRARRTGAGRPDGGSLDGGRPGAGRQVAGRGALAKGDAKGAGDVG